MNFVFLYSEATPLSTNLIFFMLFKLWNSFLFNIPLLLTSKTRTLLTIRFSWPKDLAISEWSIFLSMYIHKSLSNVLFVEGEPSNEIMSFVLDLFTTNCTCFLSKKWTPWCFSTFFRLQEVRVNDIINNKNIFFMNKNYINIYNNLVKLTRNKELYKNFKNQDTFSDRLIFFLLHFAFFLKIYKENNNKKLLQEIYDFIFRQMELSIREIGYGDQSINKKMKDYLNLFYGMIDKIHDWDTLSLESRTQLLEKFLDNATNSDHLAIYFEKYRIILTNNTLNSYIKGIV